MAYSVPGGRPGGSGGSAGAIYAIAGTTAGDGAGGRPQYMVRAVDAVATAATAAANTDRAAAAPPPLPTGPAAPDGGSGVASRERTRLVDPATLHATATRMHFCHLIPTCWSVSVVAGAATSTFFLRTVPPVGK